MNRVVVTGLGVVAPNAIGLPAFDHAIRSGISGIRLIPQMQALGFGCQVAGLPDYQPDYLAQYFPEHTIKSLKSTSAHYGCTAATEAWLHAGLPLNNTVTDWDAGCIFGITSCDADMIVEGARHVDAGENRKLGSRFIEQQMSSNVSGYMSGLLGLGNHSFANASACCTGTESVLLAYEKIKEGRATRMLTGSAEASSLYIWAAFDAMRVLSRRFNDNPAAASRPMSATAVGFVPAGGAAALVLEKMETALERGATIYAEIAGGAMNAGGQRNGGSMTAPNPEGVVRCIKAALANSNTNPATIDLICGHLTATMADPLEVRNWCEALGRSGGDFPFINSLKSMTGHALGATGSIESVAAILQLYHNFVHPTINCEDLHPKITAQISASKIAQTATNAAIDVVIKANFGFGDVNACLVFKKFKP
jgi:3-oxoacyl-(acyl-carrier-protein) synthase